MIDETQTFVEKPEAFGEQIIEQSKNLKKKIFREVKKQLLLIGVDEETFEKFILFDIEND